MTSIRDVTATHLATLNLFRNPDGSVNVTVFEGRGATAELGEQGKQHLVKGHAYVMQLVREAVLPRPDLSKDQPIASLGRVVVNPDQPVSLYSAACDRLFDMLLGDDGEAWSQAERFLKQHRPDLYNRIGMNLMPEPNPEPED